MCNTRRIGFSKGSILDCADSYFLCKRPGCPLEEDAKSSVCTKFLPLKHPFLFGRQYRCNKPSDNAGRHSARVQPYGEDRRHKRRQIGAMIGKG